MYNEYQREKREQKLRIMLWTLNHDYLSSIHISA